MKNRRFVVYTTTCFPAQRGEIGRGTLYPDGKCELTLTAGYCPLEIIDTPQLYDTLQDALNLEVIEWFRWWDPKDTSC